MHLASRWVQLMLSSCVHAVLTCISLLCSQLTGDGNAKGSFFPRMRERLKDRNHKVADYDVCL